ncbi:sensor histidine kinase [Bradyrhizobium sp. AUGA SZCCT0431]|uniref:sensor histidine kinase n=1 Tax=Bradyrhizobium sp. AUGA SZCCT0431 TaxID=2807674 RepID=UPI00201203AE|nr:sensor histidine kinase [Bradyrhizobium sp. AUGA SZCCT0431]
MMRRTTQAAAPLLQVLSLTNALRDRDFDGFRRIVTGFLEQYGRDGVVLVADREGRQLFSSVTTDTAALQLRNNLDIVEKVFATKPPHYSNLFTGVVKKSLIVTVEVPVIRDGEALYDISFSPPIEIFQAMIEQQLPGQDWTISIFDGEGINFARVPNLQNTISQRASPSLYAELFRKPAKYGALSNDSGTVALDWEIIEQSDGRELRMIWTESGGPHVSAPVQRGFGSRLIERSARDQLGGEATVDFLPRGVVCTVTAALEQET